MPPPNREYVCASIDPLLNAKSNTNSGVRRTWITQSAKPAAHEKELMSIGQDLFLVECIAVRFCESCSVTGRSESKRALGIANTVTDDCHWTNRSSPWPAMIGGADELDCVVETGEWKFVNGIHQLYLSMIGIRLWHYLRRVNVKSHLASHRSRVHHLAVCW